MAGNKVQVACNKFWVTSFKLREGEDAKILLVKTRKVFSY